MAAPRLVMIGLAVLGLVLCAVALVRFGGDDAPDGLDRSRSIPEPDAGDLIEARARRRPAISETEAGVGGVAAGRQLTVERRCDDSSVRRRGALTGWQTCSLKTRACALFPPRSESPGSRRPSWR